MSFIVRSIANVYNKSIITQIFYSFLGPTIFLPLSPSLPLISSLPMTATAHGRKKWTTAAPTAAVVDVDGSCGPTAGQGDGDGDGSTRGGRGQQRRT